jgi:hypothetical protein
MTKAAVKNNCERKDIHIMLPDRYKNKDNNIRNILFQHWSRRKSTKSPIRIAYEKSQEFKVVSSISYDENL